MAYINQTLTIRKFIERIDGLYPIIFNRIYVGSLPAENQAQPCISVRVLGGDSNPDSEVQNLELEIRFWGYKIVKGIESAPQVARELYGLFQNGVYDKTYDVTLPVGAGRVIAMNEVSPGIDAVDLDTEWRFVVALWRMTVNSRVA